MEPDFDVRDAELEKFIVFRASFNRFEPINASQAWSLIVSAGRDDGLFGVQATAGWFIVLSVLTGLILVVLERLDVGTL